jgi:hypothetical protein
MDFSFFNSPKGGKNVGMVSETKYPTNSYIYQNIFQDEKEI